MVAIDAFEVCSTALPLCNVVCNVVKKSLLSAGGEHSGVPSFEQLQPGPVSAVFIACKA